MSEDAKLYELGFHIIPTVTEDKVTDVFADITGIISKNGGEVVKSAEPKAIELAYTIIKKIGGQNQRFSSAYFAWIIFNASSEAVEKIKAEAKADERIVRYLIVKTVDDFEHSTAKLAAEESESSEGEEEDGDSKKEDDSKKAKSVSEEKVVRSKKTVSKKAVSEKTEKVKTEIEESEVKSETAKTETEADKNQKIDEAIDGLIDGE